MYFDNIPQDLYTLCMPKTYPGKYRTLSVLWGQAELFLSWLKLQGECGQIAGLEHTCYKCRKASLIYQDFTLDPTRIFLHICDQHWCILFPKASDLITSLDNHGSYHS